MFEWNEEEVRVSYISLNLSLREDWIGFPPEQYHMICLTNIIWNVDGENEDHIVPYPIQNEEKFQVLFRDTVKANQQTSNDKKTLPAGSNPESLSRFNLNSRFDDLEKYATNSTEADCDDTNSIISNSAIKSLKVFSLGEANGQYDPEDKEQDDSVDDEWATIGSFDNLDNIFSNPIFEEMSRNTNVQWPSSNNASSHPSRRTSTNETIYSFPSFSEKSNNIRSLPHELQIHEKRPTCQSQHDGSNLAKQRELPDELFPCVQDYKQKLLLKGHQFHQINSQNAQSMTKNYSQIGHCQQMQFQRNSSESSTKPPEMSPLEKIEKLRRRQQLRAIIAIQKQRQRFSNRVSVNENSTLERMNGKVDENDNFSVLDNGSQIEHDDSKTVRIPLYNFSPEESVLNHLQNAISKLDVQVRLCIRNSLFRLAQSARERHCFGDAGSENMNRRDDNIRNADIHNHERFTGVLDLETDTNPIDRIVANLVFHTPMQFSGELSAAPSLPFYSDHSPESSPFSYFEKNWSVHEVPNGLMNVEASKS